MNALQNPTRMACSSNGQEIWDWATRVSSNQQRAIKAESLLKSYVSISNECGSCALWMTKQCPKEINNNGTGRSSGPSCTSPTCSKFDITPSSKKILEQKLRELTTIKEMK